MTYTSCSSPLLAEFFLGEALLFRLCWWSLLCHAKKQIIDTVNNKTEKNSLQLSKVWVVATDRQLVLTKIKIISCLKISFHSEAIKAKLRNNEDETYSYTDFTQNN